MKHHVHIHGLPGTGKSTALKMLADRFGSDVGMDLTPSSCDKHEMLTIVGENNELLVITTGLRPDPSAACNVELPPLRVNITFSKLSADVWSHVWPMLKVWFDKQALDAALPSPSPMAVNGRSRM